MYHEAFEAFFEYLVSGLSQDSEHAEVLNSKLKTTLYGLVESGHVEIPEQFVALGANNHDMPDLPGGYDLDDNVSLLSDFDTILSDLSSSSLSAEAIKSTFKIAEPHHFANPVIDKKNNQIFSALFAKAYGSDQVIFIQPPTNEATMNAPCKYNTFVTPSFKLLSEHYHYANVVEGISVCSHPAVINKPSSSVTPCLQMHDQMSCSMYDNNVEILATANAPVSNTSRVDQFSLSYTPLINFFENQFAHAFIIQNMNDNSVVSQMLLPDHEFVYDDALVEAERIFDEYMAAYTQISKTGPIASEEAESVSVPAQPYFAQLFS